MSQPLHHSYTSPHTTLLCSSSLLRLLLLTQVSYIPRVLYIIINDLDMTVQKLPGLAEVDMSFDLNGIESSMDSFFIDKYNKAGGS